MKRTLRTITAAAAIAFGALAPASANAAIVKTDDRTFTAKPALCSCQSTIDGRVFVGMPYSPFVRDWLGLPSSTETAVELYWKLLEDPNYVSLPPVTSVSVQTTVSGTVEEPTEDDDGEL